MYVLAHAGLDILRQCQSPLQKISTKKIKHLMGNGPTAQISPAETVQSVNLVPRLKKKQCFLIYMYIYNKLLPV